MPGCRLPPLRATVPTLLACCVGCVLFQSRLAMVHEEVSRMHEEGLFSRRVRLMPESRICPADGASAAPRELLEFFSGFNLGFVDPDAASDLLGRSM